MQHKEMFETIFKNMMKNRCLGIYTLFSLLHRLFNDSQLEHAQELLQKTRENFQLSKQEDQLLKNKESLLLFLIGSKYQKQQNDKKAKQYYMKGLQLKRELNHKEGIAQFSIAVSLIEEARVSERSSSLFQQLEQEICQAFAQPAQFLNTLLTDDNWLVRREALETLAEIGNIDAIIPALEHESMQTRMDAIIALEKIADKRIARQLMLMLKNQQELWFIRWRAAKTLGKIQCQEALELLRKTALYDQHSFVRAGAWQALGMFADKNICHLLVKGLDDPDVDVRAAVILVLENRGDENAIPYLEKTTDGLDSSGQTLEKIAEQAIRSIESRIKR